MPGTLIDTTVPAPSEEFELEVLALGRRLGEGARSARSAKGVAYDRAMAFAASDEELRAALFRLVDVAPACSGPAELASHLAAYLDGVETDRMPVALGSRAADSAIFRGTTG